MQHVVLVAALLQLMWTFDGHSQAQSHDQIRVPQLGCISRFPPRGSSLCIDPIVCHPFHAVVITMQFTSRAIHAIEYILPLYCDSPCLHKCESSRLHWGSSRLPFARKQPIT